MTQSSRCVELCNTPLVGGHWSPFAGAWARSSPRAPGALWCGGSPHGRCAGSAPEDRGVDDLPVARLESGQSQAVAEAIERRLAPLQSRRQATSRRPCCGMALDSRVYDAYDLTQAPPGLSVYHRGGLRRRNQG